MTVFRIEKTKNYTIMSNHHLRNETLSLKAKGLLSQMLSLPENWDFSLKGLSQINRESVDAIRTAVQELEAAGYIVRRQMRDERGRMAHIEYIIYEQPQSVPTLENPTPVVGDQTLFENRISDEPISDNPVLNQPVLENPTSENPTPRHPTERNKDRPNKELINKESYQSIYPALNEKPPDGIDRRSAAEIYRDMIKDNIEFDALCLSYDPERVTEILELMLDTVCSQRKHFRISGEDLPAEVVKSRFLKLNQFHVEYVIKAVSETTVKIRNIQNYLLTALFHAPSTMCFYFDNLARSDLRFKG